MSLRIYVSRDAGAVAVGAEEVASALAQAATTRGVNIEIVRTGSRGMYWLEPLIEVATPPRACCVRPGYRTRCQFPARRDDRGRPASAAARPHR